MKNISPITLYFLSLVSLVTANMVRETTTTAYLFLLILGVVFLILGVYKKFKK